MGGYNEALVRALLAAGHTVAVISSDPTRLPEGCRYHPAFRRAVDRRRGRLSRLAAYAVSMVKVVALGVRNDVVVWHFSAVPPIDLLALRLLRASGRRVVVVVHDPQPLSRVAAPRLQHHVTAAASLVVVHGPAARDALALEMNGRAKEVFVGAHGDFPRASPLSRAESLAALGVAVPEGSRICSVIGNLKPSKGIDRVLASLPALRAAGHHVLVAGSPQGNPELEDRIGAAAAGGGVTHVLRRLTDHEESAAYSLSDVVLAMYDNGYSSGVIATAHALGRPVVMTDVGDFSRQAGPNDIVLPLDWRPEDLVRALTSTAARDRAGMPDRPERLRDDAWSSLSRAIVGEETRDGVLSGSRRSDSC